VVGHCTTFASVISLEENTSQSEGQGIYLKFVGPLEGCAGPLCCRARSVEVEAKNQLADLICYDPCYMLLLVM
jgi:hypothetical protein